jgi:hypothetical protein
MRARFRDMLDDARTLHRLALLQFTFEGGVPARGHRNLFHHLLTSFNFMRTNPLAAHKRRNRTPSRPASSSHKGCIADQSPDSKARRRDQVSEK